MGHGASSMKTVLRIVLILLAGSLPAWAALGEYEGSVSLDQRIMRAEMRAEAHTNYKLQEMMTPDGAVIREYVSPDGRVFGVSWRSPVLPDLSQLLGSYFPRVQRAVQARRQRGGPLVIHSEDFVYFSGGRMMNFHGRAYVPALLPKNTSAEVVR